MKKHFAGATFAVALLIAGSVLAQEVRVSGLNINTQGCSETRCTTAGDGGCLAAINGTDYAITVSSEAAVRVANGTPPATYATGTGMVVTAGAMLYPQRARPAPDGGAPNYCCTSQSDDAGAPTMQICPVVK